MPMPDKTTDDAPLTQDEMFGMFDGEIPIEVVAMVWGAPDNTTVREMRRQVREFAAGWKGRPKVPDGPQTTINEGRDRLWSWFGLSRAAFLTLPRVLMHEMPDDWQNRMAALLEEYNATYRNLPPIGSTVRAMRDGRMIPMPEVFANYRHPDRAAIDALRTAQTKTPPGGDAERRV